MMFFFNLCKLLIFLVIVVFVKICVVFWNDVVEMKDFVDREVFVILSNLCLYLVLNFLFFFNCLFLLSILVSLVCFFFMKDELLEFEIIIFCSIC